MRKAEIGKKRNRDKTDIYEKRTAEKDEEEKGALRYVLRV